MRHHPRLWLHPMNRSSWSWNGFPAGLHPEQAGEGDGEDEDEEEDAKGEHNTRRGEAELWVWTLREAYGLIYKGVKLTRWRYPKQFFWKLDFLSPGAGPELPLCALPSAPCPPAPLPSVQSPPCPPCCTMCTLPPCSGGHCKPPPVAQAASRELQAGLRAGELR